MKPFLWAVSWGGSILLPPTTVACKIISSIDNLNILTYLTNEGTLYKPRVLLTLRSVAPSSMSIVS